MPVVLVGNPNVGKSVVFRALTGRYVEVSNFPGTTVGIRRARAAGLAVWDSPGVYGLSRFTDEERVTVEAVRQADLIVNVVDARHLARDLFLTLQLKSLALPMVVLLNRMDEVRAAGDFLDAPGLERALGVPVIKAAAVRGEGIPELLQCLQAGAVKPPPAPPFWEDLPPAVQRRSPVDRLLWWEEDEELSERLQTAPPAGNREAEYVKRRQEADALASRFYRRGDGGYGRWQLQLDGVLLHPVWGWAVLVAVLGAVYQLLGVEVANRLVGWLEALLRQTWVPWVQAALSPLLAPGSLGAELLTGRYGLLTMTVTYLVALLLPLITGFECLLAVLEDTGYLPRLATLLDRFFLRLGLNGRSVIPLILGFGCVTMATLTTRILEGHRERTIASVLLAWTIPCSAQVGVITGLLAGLGARWALAYAAVILSLFILVGTALDRALPGRPTPLLLDLPPLSWPRAANLWDKVRTKVGGFLLEAGPLFALGSLTVAMAHWSGALGSVETALGPFFTRFLHLPGEAAPAFLLGFIRRDFGAVGLYQAGLSPVQILTGAVTITLFVPCIASTLVLLRERGVRQGMEIWLGSIAIALLCGAAVARVAEWIAGA